MNIYTEILDMISKMMINEYLFKSNILNKIIIFLINSINYFLIHEQSQLFNKSRM